MKGIIDYLKKNVKIEEGDNVFEDILTKIYMNKGVSVKALSREELLPVPIIAAIKNELIKSGVITQDRGIRMTGSGKYLVEKELGYDGIDINFCKDAVLNNDCFKVFKDYYNILEDIFHKRPEADVTVDQSKCTLETSLKRALLCLKYNSLIGKEILCVGDDDMVSVSLGFLLKNIYPSKSPVNKHIHVIDADMRFIEYINEVSGKWNLPVKCHYHDLRKPIPEALENRFDCFFTDPPYTIEGLRLFLSRGITALKNKKGLPVFLSFAHKSPGFTLDMFDELLKMGLMVCEVVPRFNEYEGAQIIGSTSQMSVLKTTGKTCAAVSTDFSEPLYTGELKKTIRIYTCGKCGREYKTSADCYYKTIEQLKKSGCIKCKTHIFKLKSKKRYET